MSEDADIEIEIEMTVVRAGKRMPTRLCVTFPLDPDMRKTAAYRLVYVPREPAQAAKPSLNAAQSTGSADAGTVAG